MDDWNTCQLTSDTHYSQFGKTTTLSFFFISKEHKEQQQYMYMCLCDSKIISLLDTNLGKVSGVLLGPSVLIQSKESLMSSVDWRSTTFCNEHYKLLRGTESTLVKHKSQPKMLRCEKEMFR